MERKPLAQVRPSQHRWGQSVDKETAGRKEKDFSNGQNDHPHDKPAPVPADSPAGQSQSEHQASQGHMSQDRPPFPQRVIAI